MSQSNRVLPLGILEKFENKQLKHKWEKSEYLLTKYLDKNLPKEWIIHTRPEFLKEDQGWGSKINRKTPDIVIAHPEQGIMVFEVKDWNVDAYQKSIKKLKNGKEIWEIFPKHLKYKTKNKNPVSQVKSYLNILRDDVYEILEEIVEDSKKSNLLKAAVYMHGISNEEAKKFLGYPKFVTSCLILTDDILENKKIDQIVPLINNSNKIKSKSNWLIKFQNWISPPIHKLEKDEVISFGSLDSQQKIYTTPKANVAQKLSGVAGSGKTRIIAGRAINLASLNKNVLIFCYNITIKNYIKEELKKTQISFPRKMIEVHHFHGFQNLYMYDRDLSYIYNSSKKIDFNKSLQNCIADKKNNLNKTFNYDAILIDEAQDFEFEWFEFIKLFLNNNKEMLIVRDLKQNLYGREKDSLRGVGSGRWGVLKKGYRLLNDHVEMINNFSKKYLVNLDKDEETPFIDTLKQEQHSLPFNPEPSIKAYNVADFLEAEKKLKEIIDFLLENKKHKAADIAVLVSTEKEGLRIKDFLTKNYANKFSIAHIFFNDDIAIRKSKILFKVGGDKLKLCTIKSFKGWERRDIIILTNNNSSQANLYDHELYTAISRVREKLFIINQNKRYSDFFKNY